jgi:hypothetical protein
MFSTTPWPLYTREGPGTHCTGGWVGPRASLDVCEKSRPTGIFFIFYFVVLVLFWYWTKDGMLWIFPAGKIRRLRSGANPRSWVPEASMQTPRPPKPLDSIPGPAARSQLLYLLSYPAHTEPIKDIYISAHLITQHCKDLWFVYVSIGLRVKLLHFDHTVLVFRNIFAIKSHYFVIQRPQIGLHKKLRCPLRDKKYLFNVVYRMIKKSLCAWWLQYKTRKNILNSFSHLSHSAILNTVFENTVRRVNKCLETGGGHLEHYL